MSCGEVVGGLQLDDIRPKHKRVGRRDENNYSQEQDCTSFHIEPPLVLDDVPHKHITKLEGKQTNSTIMAWASVSLSVLRYPSMREMDGFCLSNDNGQEFYFIFILLTHISFLVEICLFLVKICYSGLTGKEKEFSIGVPGEM